MNTKEFYSIIYIDNMCTALKTWIFKIIFDILPHYCVVKCTGML